MIAEFMMATVLNMAQTPAWTWTLYEGSGPVVLANERPDTPDLRSTLECVAGSGLVRVSVYEADPTPGAARLESGSVATAVEAVATADGSMAAPVRVDAPVFARFAATGDLTFTIGEHRNAIDVGAADLPKLRRFVELCSG
jgi:hypothetical protein